MKQKEVRAEAGRCHFILRFPHYLKYCPIPKIRKMFILICRYSYQNEQVIHEITECIQDFLLEAKGIWSQNSTAYNTGFRDPYFNTTKEQKATIKRHNALLLNAVKEAKNQVDRVEKIMDIWNTAKATYSIKEEKI